MAWLTRLVVIAAFFALGGTAEAQLLLQGSSPDPSQIVYLGLLQLTAALDPSDDERSSDSRESPALSLSLSQRPGLLTGEITLGLSPDQQPVRAQWQLGLGKISFNLPFDSFRPERGVLASRESNDSGVPLNPTP